MPHVVIELSRNVADRLDIAAVVKNVHGALRDTGILPVRAIKTRAIVHEHFAVGNDGGTALGFATAIIRIQPGRPAESEQAVGQAAFDALCQALEPIKGISVSVSVDVQHINSAASFSRVAD